MADIKTIHQLHDGETLSAYASEMRSLGALVEDTANSVNFEWSSTLPTVFHVKGAEQIFDEFTSPAASADAFHEAMKAGAAALERFVNELLPDLKTRRTDLVTRYASARSAVKDASDDIEDAEEAYWRAYGSDPDSVATTNARTSRLDAHHASERAIDNLGSVEKDIDVFNEDVETDERGLASSLLYYVGGEHITDARGKHVDATQSYWGRPAPRLPGDPTQPIQSLADRLEHDLSTGAENRLKKLASSSPEEVKAWLETHPDYVSAVSFIDPVRAANLFESLAQESSRNPDNDWVTGPLAMLLTTAPSLIGNLSGIPSAEKSRFNEAQLRAYTQGYELTGEQQQKLAKVQKLLDDQSATLLTLFIDQNGEPRVSIGYGDLDNADQITTVTHGIQTDVGNIEEWASITKRLRADVDDQNSFMGTKSSGAFVLFMEWDSGSAENVVATNRPNAGAERLNQLVSGLHNANPAAQQNMVAHSLGTTMTGQAIWMNPHLFDNVYFVGSAGITVGADNTIQTYAGSNGTIDVSATHARLDYIAPLGRVVVEDAGFPFDPDVDIGSRHAIDPRKVDDVVTFGSDGGEVPRYHGDPLGLPVQGHNSSHSFDLLYRVPRVTKNDNGDIVIPPDSRGYFDADSQTFKEIIVRLGDDASEWQARG